MNFLIDAHLPFAIGRLLKEKGQKVLHTNELPLGNATDDKAIISFSMQEKSVVVTKDLDFYHSFTARRVPYKLLLLKTGNLKKAKLTDLFERNLITILEALKENGLVELTEERIKIVE